MRPRTPNIIQDAHDVATSSTHDFQQQQQTEFSQEEIDTDSYCCRIDQAVASSSDVSFDPLIVEEDHPQHRKRRRRRPELLNVENNVDEGNGIDEDVDYLMKITAAATNIPPINVPQPQILSDSKKTSSPRRYRLNTDIQSRIFRVTLLIHLFSLFACTATSHFVRSHDQSTENSNCTSFAFSTEQRKSTNFTLKTCQKWKNSSIEHICKHDAKNRPAILSDIYLFTEYQPLSLFDIFAANSKNKANTSEWRLINGVNSTKCVFGNQDECGHCFKMFNDTINKLEVAYSSFDTTLSRFDCQIANDSATATRPFSPNATCANCKLWYRRWLLVQELNIWKSKPCINWCYYTQLACPHLAPAKVWDYAGHPSFQCRDMDIDSWRQECDCIHPCDVQGVVPNGTIGNEPSIRHDFFAAEVHCKQRKKECQKQASKKSSQTTKKPTTTSKITSTTTTTTSKTITSIGFNCWTTHRLFHYFLLILLWMLYE